MSTRKATPNAKKQKVWAKRMTLQLTRQRWKLPLPWLECERNQSSRVTTHKVDLQPFPPTITILSDTKLRTILVEHLLATLQVMERPTATATQEHRTPTTHHTMEPDLLPRTMDTALMVLPRRHSHMAAQDKFHLPRWQHPSAIATRQRQLPEALLPGHSSQPLLGSKWRNRPVPIDVCP